VTHSVTLISGTSKGIGRYLAEYYCGRGHVVYGCSRSAPDWSHKSYSHLLADVTDESQAKAVFSQIRRERGRLDNLINNAGIASMNHSLLTPLATVRRVLDTNVAGCFLFCREAAKVMKNSGYGRIVNFSTVAVSLNLEGEAAYVSSKAAVEALTRVLAREFGEFGITVNSIGPVPIATDLIKGVPSDKIQRIVQMQAIKRMGRYQDISNVTDFFVQKGSDFITGQNIYLGGL